MTSFVLRLSHPTVCHLQYLSWGRSGKLVTFSGIGWTCGGVAHSFCTALGRLSGPEKCRQDDRSDTQWTVAVAAIGRTLTYSFTKNVPLLHASTQRPCTCTSRDKFYQAFPRVSFARTSHPSLLPQVCRFCNANILKTSVGNTGVATCTAPINPICPSNFSLAIEIS